MPHPCPTHNFCQRQPPSALQGKSITNTPAVCSPKFKNKWFMP
nr:MAG TPA: hypothetical protein [Caudoviricetes sp.]